MPKKPATVKTIVTTDLQARIAEKYGATCFECLTGFKWIADLMRRFESDDAGSAARLRVRLRHRGELRPPPRERGPRQGRHLGRRPHRRDDPLLAVQGQEPPRAPRRALPRARLLTRRRASTSTSRAPTGMDVMKGIMEGYRESQPACLGGIAVAADPRRQAGLEWPAGRIRRARRDGRSTCPPSDVIQWILEDGTKVTVRPSGTEPKIKFYVLLRSEVDGRRRRASRRRARSSAAKAEAIAADIRKAIGRRESRGLTPRPRLRDDGPRLRDRAGGRDRGHPLRLRKGAAASRRPRWPASSTRACPYRAGQRHPRDLRRGRGGAPAFGEVRPPSSPWPRAPSIVAHNVRFDLSFLDAELSRLGHLAPRGRDRGHRGPQPAGLPRPGELQARGDSHGARHRCRRLAPGPRRREDLHAAIRGLREADA